jgi:hypothetical protein
VEGILAGICVGCLIGIVTGMMTLLILLDTIAPRSKEISHVERIFGRRQSPGIRLSAKLSMIAPHWFGGFWMTAYVMNGVRWQKLWPPYLATLAAVYVSIIAAPLSHLVIRVCRKIQGRGYLK